MDIRKNDRIELTIEDMSDTGDGIGKSDGFTWFVKDAVIGDRVEASVMKLKKTYGFARLQRVITPSPDRVEPPCPAARRCGGCQLQAMSYEKQLEFRENKVFYDLVRIGGFTDLVRGAETESSDESGYLMGELSPSGTQPEDPVISCDEKMSAPVFLPIIGMKEPWRYRNKAQFPFGRDKDGRIITGFYASRTHDIIEQEDCLLGVSENAQILRCIREYMEEFHVAPYDETTHTGLVRHALIRKGFRTGELMVCLVINGSTKELKHAEVLVERLCALYPGYSGEAGEMDSAGDAGTGQIETIALPRMTSISCSINRERTNVIMGSEIINLYGPGYITDYIGNIRYRISPLSFYQVNPVQTGRLYGTALEYAGLTGNETVWDLYCGIGTISLFLAQKAKKVYGVEIVPQAIEDARANAELNGITNTEFFVGKAEEVLPAFYEKIKGEALFGAGVSLLHPDVIVVDPPRKGCDRCCLDTIVKMAPQKVVYVSCDPATLARDAKHLCANGYRLVKVRPCDMFPCGVHVETVCLLTRKK